MITIFHKFTMSSNDNISAINKYSTYNLFKFMCKVIRVTCYEEFWYEAKSTGRNLLWGYIIISVYLFVVFGDETLEVIFNTYPTDLHRDVVLLSITQGSILFRLFYNSYKRTEAKELIKDMIDVCREYEVEHIQHEQHKRFRFCLLLHSAVVGCYVIFLLITSLRRYFFEDQPLVFVAVYWPKFEDVTTTGLIFKFCVFLFILLLAIYVVVKDTLIILKLIVITYKFPTLCCYFENLYKDFEDKDVTIIEMKHKCLKGIEMHRELLRITNKFVQLYDILLSIQVSQGFTLVVMLMLKMSVTTDFFSIIMSLIYLAIMVGQLGLFMWNAGDVTYQASLLPTSIFHCGWHLRPVNCEHSRAIRRLVLMGCLQAQKPLVLKAFGIQDVSYRSFLSVIQTSYSIFAVFRAK